jgi:bacteriorhodopsin
MTCLPAQYVWYVQWLINLPLLLLSLLLVTGLSLLEILLTLFAALALVLSALVADHSPPGAPYAPYARVLSLGALAEVVYVLLAHGTRSAFLAGPSFGRRYLACAALLALALLGYPAANALAHLGSGTAWDALSPAGGVCGAYGVLDVLAQPVFLLFLLHQLSRIDPGAVCGRIALGTDEEEQMCVRQTRRLRRHRGTVLVAY